MAQRPYLGRSSDLSPIVRLTTSPYRLVFLTSSKTVLGIIVFGLVLDVARVKYDATYCCGWQSNGLHAVG
jgi:hypothetical protein